MIKAFFLVALTWSFSAQAAPFANFGWYQQKISQIEDNAWTIQGLTYRVDRDLYAVLSLRYQTGEVAQAICEAYGFTQARSHEASLVSCEETFSWIIVDQKGSIQRLNRNAVCPGYGHSQIHSLICER